MSKPPLLLLHGAIGTAQQFDTLLPLLADHFDLHPLDFPGHGNGDPAEVFSISLFASSVLNYMDSHHISSPHAFGYSMGGYVALCLAAHHPGRLQKVFTLATKFAWTPESAAKESAQLDPGKISEKVPDFAAALRRSQAPQDWKEVLYKTASLLRNLGEQPPLVPSVLSSIRIPVRIGIGEWDKMVSMEESLVVANLIPDGKLQVLPSTPHPFEKADMNLLATRIRSFFL